MSELKPCPFCGGEQAIKTRYIGYGSPGLGSHDEYRVVCKECRASSDEYKSEAEAIAAWNRRSDAMPVVRGEWVLVGTNEHDYETSVEEKCSLCGRYVYRYDTQPQDNYCPNCGAKIGGEKHE